MSFYFPMLKTVFTLGTPFSLYSFDAGMFFIEVGFNGENPSSSLNFDLSSALSLKQSSNKSSEMIGFKESLLG